jgi:hypothetical protein
MCGRFACSLGHEAVKQRLRENKLSPSEWIDEDKYEGTYNVAPTYFIPVVRFADNQYHLHSMVCSSYIVLYHCLAFKLTLVHTEMGFNPVLEQKQTRCPGRFAAADIFISMTSSLLIELWCVDH